MSRFFLNPHVNEDGQILVGDQIFSPQSVVDKLRSHMREERFAKIGSVVEKRTLQFVPVLEDIYDRGNASAVMRTAEGLGIQNIHLIQPSSQFKESNRVTQGADKWLDTCVWKETRACIESLKKNGFQIAATCFDENAKEIQEIDFSQPTALVLGNEKKGISEEMKSLADHKVIIPMRGFIQSFNISVAGALAFYHALNAANPAPAYVTEGEALILRATYCLKSVEHAERILLEGSQAV